MPERVRMGICGFGWSAQTFHLPLIRATSSIDLVAAFDAVPERRAVATSVGIPFTEPSDRLEDAVRTVGLDLVLIASPNSLHGEHAEAAIRGGAHVVVEKPVGDSAAEVRHLGTVAGEHDRIIIPFHNRLLDREHALVRELIAANVIGRLLSIETAVSCATPPIGQAAPQFRPRWRVERRFGGGILSDWGPHKIAQLQDLLWPKALRCRAAWSCGGVWAQDCDDAVDAALDADDVHVRMVLSYLDAARRERWRVTGTAGTITVTGSDARGEVTVATHTETSTIAYENRITDWLPLYAVACRAILHRECDPATSLWQRAESVYGTIDEIRALMHRPQRSQCSGQKTVDVTDAAEWDDLIARARGGTVFHSSVWTNEVGSRFTRVGLRDRGNLIAGVIVENTEGAARRTLTPYSGPVIRDGSFDPEHLLRPLVHALAERSPRCLFIASPWAPSLSAFVCSGAFRARLLYSGVVDLRTLDDAHAGFSGQLRRNLRLAGRTLVIERTDTSNIVLELVRRTFARQGLQVWFGEDDARERIDRLLVAGKAATYVARDAIGIAVAAILVTWDRRRAYYTAGGYDERCAHRGGTSLALWRAMQDIREHVGLTTFDLEGSHFPAIARHFAQFRPAWLPYYVVTREEVRQ